MRVAKPSSRRQRGGGPYAAAIPASFSSFAERNLTPASRVLLLMTLFIFVKALQLSIAANLQ
jgi:hypothetical protein